MNRMGRALGRVEEEQASESKRIGRSEGRLHQRLDDLELTAVGTALAELKRGFKSFSGDVRRRLDEARDWHDAGEKTFTMSSGSENVQENEELMGICVPRYE